MGSNVMYMVTVNTLDNIFPVYCTIVTSYDSTSSNTIVMLLLNTFDTIDTI